MNQRAEIVQKINKASSLQEQAALVAELDAFDRMNRTAAESARSIDLTDTIIRDTLSPVAVHERSTHETDWLGDISATASNAAESVTVEAAMWYRSLTPEVKADVEEFNEQARGKARRTASAHGAQARALEAEFLHYVAFLHQREAASGLPQVQQQVDAFENPAPTQLPTETFDNFAPEVDPINQGVSGTETSERAPLIQAIEQEGGGQTGAPTHHDTAPQPYTYAEVPPQQTTARLFDAPSVAINHTMTLDDFRREAASGLDQVQQVVDSFEDPDETGLPTEVAFPWEISPDASGQAGGTPPQAPHVNEDVVKRRQAAFERRAAYVASLIVKANPTEAERAEILAFTASLQKRADQWSQSGPQAHGPSAQNSPATTPDALAGDYQAGYAEGRSDWPESAPDFADASPSIPPYAEGHAIGYQDAAKADPTPGGAQPGQMPPGAGGIAEGYQTRAASLQATAAKTVTCSSCGTQDKDYNMVQRGNGHSVDYTCRNCAPISEDPNKQRWLGSRKEAGLKISAAFTSPVDEADPEFAKAYKYAAKWKPGKRLVTTGSAAFEAGLYAGMSDNTPENQSAWSTAHRKQASKYDKPEFLSRIAKHREFSKKAVKGLSDLRVVGSYLRPVEEPVAKTAATVMDLDTTSPTSSPSPTGQTPINGPGEPGPLAGGTDPAAPAGAAPYNGAAPYGSSVVPNRPVGTGAPATIDATPGAAVDKAALEHLSPQALAFRKTVQANLLKSAAAKVPVCNGCGEAFDSRETAHEAHGKNGCGSREDGNTGYTMTPEDKAW